MDKQVICDLLKQKKFAALKNILKEQIPADIASLILELKSDELLGDHDIVLLFRILPKELAAEAFAYMDSNMQMVLINAFSDSELKEVIEELYIDDTVDIIEEMPANVVLRILKNADAATRLEINQILRYPKNSAGSVMTTEYVYLKKELNVKEAFEKIRKNGLAKETIYTCYVLENKKLIGTVSVLDMLVSDYDTKIEDIMQTNFVCVNTLDDREEVANKLSKYDLAAIAVVDNDNRMVGIVTFDDALDVLRQEDTEDIEKMAAITPSDKPYMKMSVFSIFKRRIPWLMLLMISATFTGMILAHFESALAIVPALTVFIPMLMDTGGNSGSQASVTIIRGLSLDEIQFKDILKVMWKEFRVGVLCAVVIAAIVFGKVMLIDRKGINIALVVALTIFVVIVIAKLVGCTLPMLAKKVGLDAAVMASPFITTIVDALALLIYFVIASSVLGI